MALQSMHTAPARLQAAAVKVQGSHTMSWVSVRSLQGLSCTRLHLVL